MLDKSRIHPNLIEAIARTLSEIFENNKYADKAIEYTLKSNKKWGSRDRSFIAENTYEIVRHYRLFSYILDELKIKYQPESKYKLLFGIYQILRGKKLPEWREFEALNHYKIHELLDKSQKVKKIYESYPDWMDELMRSEIGNQWTQEMVALNEKADVILRVNTLKIKKQALRKVLEIDNQINTIQLPDYPDALVLEKRKNVFQTESFKNGYFEVQDASSQLVAYAGGPKPGMRIIDACAGGGGKSLHIAALMENKGKIIAMDVEEWKLNNLKKRAARGGISILETKLIENSKTIKRLEQSADRLYLDVPCSGTGVLKRNPDAKWKLDLEFINKTKELQKEILENYERMLKPGGLLIYSTCSILPSENEAQVSWFLNKFNNYDLLDQNAYLPSKTGFDGFFIAVLKKN